MTRWTTLLEPADLSAILATPDLVILDCRFSLQNTKEGLEDYADSHIPGSIYANLDAHLSSAVVPGKTGRHPLPDIEAAESFMRRSGVSSTTQVVAYDDSGGAFASRAWWVLKWLGHEAVAVLNGGWQDWTSGGFPVDQLDPTPGVGNFTARPRADMLVDNDAIDRVVASSNTLLLDARAAERYRGETEPLDPVAGHIPGALSAPFKNNLDESGRFKNPDTLKHYYSGIIPKSRPDSAREIVCYCGSGVTGAHDVLALEHAGYARPRLYAGSWSQWITDRTRKIELGD